MSIDDGRIAAVGGGSLRDGRGTESIDLASVVLLPGLVNAHTHLELSYLRNAVPPSDDFLSWIRSVVGARRQRSDSHASEIVSAVRRAIDESIGAGTAVVGDITNTLVTVEPLMTSDLAGIVFYELLRFNLADAESHVAEACQKLDALTTTDHVRVSLAAHAPYSVAPALFWAIRREMDRRPNLACSVHLSESSEEVDFINSGSGPWRAFLQEVGAWSDEWVAPGVSPVEYLDAGGFLHERLLAVHGVQMTDADLSRLRARGVTLVTCPRSNVHTGAGEPPIERFYASGVPVAVGTDSLASAPDLNVFSELATMRRLAPQVPASMLLESATRQGARALGFDGDYGTITPGRRARLLAVDVPSNVSDVEEYLVSGIDPTQVRWIDTN